MTVTGLRLKMRTAWLFHAMESYSSLSGSTVRVQGVPVPERPLLDGTATGAEGHPLVQLQAVVDEKSPVINSSTQKRRDFRLMFFCHCFK